MKNARVYGASNSSQSVIDPKSAIYTLWGEKGKLIKECRRWHI